MKPAILSMILLTLSATALPARAARTDLLSNTQAADVLSDLLTYAVDRADASTDAMQQYLKQIGKDADYDKNRPAVSHDGMSYNSVFKAAVMFVKDGGAKYADPSLKDLGKDALLDQLTDLQSYNMQQFMALNGKRETCESMRTYLKSANEWDKFVAWTEKNAPAATPMQGPATQSSANPEQLAQRMKALVEYAREIAWRKAQAMGVSEADFNKQWEQNVREHKDHVADKVEGMRVLGGSLANSDLGGTRVPQQDPQAYSSQPVGPLPPPAIWTAQPPVQRAPDNQLPAPVDSRHTREYYERKNDDVYWNPWSGQWYNRGVPLNH
jgi:hypothetical protein